MQSAYLKNIKNGEVFAYSPFIAKLPEMVPCNLDGSLKTEDVAEATAEAVTETPSAAFIKKTRKG
jgi:hypothetical protein